MVPEAQAEERYSTAVGELWSGLARTLTRLEGLAAAPQLLEEDQGIEELRRLQYRLHSASEEAIGLTPPESSKTAHGELAAALADARNASGELAECAERGEFGAAEARIYEWRGALFRVRLARLRLTSAEHAPTPAPEELPGLVAPLSALVLSLGGTAALLVGAMLGPWPLWAFGAVALCSSLLIYRP